MAPEGVRALEKQAAEGIYPDPENADYYTSGMDRTEHTLRLIYGDIEHNQITELREMNFGDYEKKSYKELKDNPKFKTWLNDTSGELSTPGGESMKGFKDRVSQGWSKMVGMHRLKELSVRHNGKPAESVVVCHGGVICAIMDASFPGEKGNFFQWAPDPGHGYTLIVDNGEIVDYSIF